MPGPRICTKCREEGKPEPRIPNHLPAYEEITGFVKLRIQGGANAVADPQPTGVMLCQEHMTLRKRGISDEQQSLV